MLEFNNPNIPIKVFIFHFYYHIMSFNHVGYNNMFRKCCPNVRKSLVRIACNRSNRKYLLRVFDAKIRNKNAANTYCIYRVVRLKCEHRDFICNISLMQCCLELNLKLFLHLIVKSLGTLEF